MATKATHGLILWMLGLALLAGCSGEYVITAPDQIATVGGDAAVVLRVQRQEVAFWYRPARAALVRMQVEDGPLRAAFADKNGYAGAAVPVGDVTGIFYLHLAHTNIRGNEYETFARTFVWDPRARVTAIDVKALPTRHNSTHQALMARLAAGSYIIYYTTESIGDHDDLRETLQQAGYPPGPIVQRQAGVTELLRERFPRLELGVAKSGRIQRNFTGTGLTLVTLEQAAETNGTDVPPPPPVPATDEAINFDKPHIILGRDRERDEEVFPGLRETEAALPAEPDEADETDVIAEPDTTDSPTAPDETPAEE